jgi:hypothetical protein
MLRPHGTLLMKSSVIPIVVAPGRSCRRARTVHVFVLVGLGLLVPSRASALDAEVTSDTAAQFSELRSPSGETILQRRRLMWTIGVGAYDLFDRPPAPHQPELTFRTRVRYDADYGASGAETETTNYGRLVPGYSRGPVDLMYGYIEGRRFLKGYLGFKLGRQYVTDALGWWSFDGGQVRITTPFYAAVELYGGLEQRGGLPLSTSRYERDGIWRGSRSDYDPMTWPSYQLPGVAPAMGVAAETAGISWFHARATYRRVNNTGTANASSFANGIASASQYTGSRVSSERLGVSFDGTLPNVGGAKAGFAYDMYMGRLANAYASLDAYASEKLTLALDYDYVQPTFDGDSIWNFFVAKPMSDLALRGNYDVSDKLSVAPAAHLRAFYNQTSQETKDASPNLGTTDPNYYETSGTTFNGGGDLAARYRWGEGALGARGSGNFGREGQRVGGDVYGERILNTRYVVNGRAGLWQWNDKLRSDREAVGFNYVAGLGYVLAPQSRVLVEWDHNMNRISGQRFRVMAWLTVAVSK